MPSPLSMPVVMALAITSEGVGPGSSGCMHTQMVGEGERGRGR